MESPISKIIHDPEKEIVLGKILQEIRFLNFMCQDFPSMGHVLSCLARDYMIKPFNKKTMSLIQEWRQEEVGYSYIVEYLRRRIALAEDGRATDSYLLKMINAFEHFDPLAVCQMSVALETFPLEAEILTQRFEDVVDSHIAEETPMEAVCRAMLDAACVCYCLGHEDELRYIASLEIWKDHIEKLNEISLDYKYQITNIIMDREKEGR